MYRSKRLLILLGVLAATCAAALFAIRFEERREQIKNSGEVVLELAADTIQSLSWEYQDETLAFYKDGVWRYEQDESFPVDEEKIGSLLEIFQAFTASFIIEEVEDFGQYGLDDPICTITIGARDNTYRILLGDYSAMDAQRYVSIGDGNVYLAQNDPLEQFDAALQDMILHDQVPEFGQVTQLQFEGTDGYAISYGEDSTASYCADDVYFTQQGGKSVPLDTDRVENYLDTIEQLELTSYVDYYAGDEELAAYGLDDPELTVRVDFTSADKDGASNSDTLVLHISRDPEQLAAAEEGSEEGESAAVAAYVRLGESRIVYRITSSEYEALAAYTYHDLRHQEVLSADFDDVNQIDVTLEGDNHSLTTQLEDGQRTWLYQGEEVDIEDIRTAITGLTSSAFTDEQPTQQQEIALTVHLDNAYFPQVEIVLYRYDGESCLAVVDGVPVALAARSDVVALIEAVQAIVLSQR